MKTNKNGFMLVEVLLAAAILAAGITAVFRASSISLRGVRMGGERYRALLLLESRLWDLELDPQAAPETDGDPSLDPVSWTLSETQEAESDAWRWRKATISWGEKGRRGDLTLSSAFLSRKP